MNSLKGILKSLVIGGLYFLMSFTVYELGCAIVSTFKDMMTHTGIHAVLFFFAMLLFVAVTGVTLWFMGAIPLVLISEIKDLKKEAETGGSDEQNNING